jgi:hypothetical protein
MVVVGWTLNCGLNGTQFTTQLPKTMSHSPKVDEYFHIAEVEFTLKLKNANKRANPNNQREQ